MVPNDTRRQTVLLTRPWEQAEKSRFLFKEAGFSVRIYPVTEILPATDWSGTDAAFRESASFSRILFSSENGVKFFWNRARELDGREGEFTGLLPRLRTIPMAAVGPATAEALAREGVSAVTVPTVFRAEDLAETLREEAAGSRFLSVRGDRGRAVLRERLEATGGVVTEISVYQTKDKKKPDEEIVRLLESGKIDWITATSPAIAGTVVRLFGDLLHLTRLVSISPLTSQALRTAGFPPAAEAIEASMAGIVRAIMA